MSKDIVMLSMYADKVKESDIQFPLHMSEKLDGMMADLYRDEFGYHIRTRQNKPIPSMQWLVDKVAKYNLLWNGKHIIGELYADYGLPRVANFNKISGRLRQEQEQATEITFNVFDTYHEALDIERSEAFASCFNTRLRNIYDIVEDYPELFKSVPYIATIQNMEELNAKYLEFMAAHPNAEGVVIRPLYGTISHYKVGRSKGFLKIVPKPTVDLKIKALEEAKGELKGHVGKVICEFAGKDIAVGMGSITHNTRRDMWCNPMEYIGKMVEIKYKDITEEGMLRMPVVVRFREDKD